MSLRSYLRRFMSKFLWMFIELTPGETLGRTVREKNFSTMIHDLSIPLVVTINGTLGIKSSSSTIICWFFWRSLLVKHSVKLLGKKVLGHDLSILRCILRAFFEVACCYLCFFLLLFPFLRIFVFFKSKNYFPICVRLTLEKRKTQKYEKFQFFFRFFFFCDPLEQWFLTFSNRITLNL